MFISLSTNNLLDCLLNKQCVVYGSEINFCKRYCLFKICFSTGNVSGKENTEALKNYAMVLRLNSAGLFGYSEVYMPRGMDEIFELPFSIQSLKVQLFMIVEWRHSSTG
jgi:hypothetical protein